MKVPTSVLRWATLVVGLVVMLCTGTLYAFSAYSDLLKSRMQWTGKQMNLAITFGLFGGTFFSFWSGYLVDKIGPRLTTLYGVALIGSCYLMIFFQVKTLFSTSSALAGILFLGVGHGGSAMWMSAMNTNVRNFSESRRTLVSGLLSMMAGLSAAIITYVYRLGGFSEKRDLLGFLLVLSVAIPVIGITGAITFTRCPPDQPQPEKKPEEEPKGDPEEEEEEEELEGAKQLVGKPFITMASSENEMVHERSDLEVEDPATPAKVDSGEITTFLGIFKSTRYMTTYIAMTLAAGAVVTFINNLKLIMIANGVDEKTILTFVAVTSYGNCSGRILFAALSFGTLAFVKGARARAFLCSPFFLLLVALLSFMFCAFMIIQGPIVSYIAAAALPISYGGWFGILPAYICTFSERRFGFNYGFVTSALAFANIAFGQVAGQLYDAFTSSGSELCYGVSCFRFTFVVCAGISGIGLACMALAYGLEVRRQLNLRVKR